MGAFLEPLGVGHVPAIDYFEVAGDSPLLPQTEEEIRRMLHALLLDKAVYEIGYELDNRPDWLPVPVRGVLDLLDEGP